MKNISGLHMLLGRYFNFYSIFSAAVSVAPRDSTAHSTSTTVSSTTTGAGGEFGGRLSDRVHRTSPVGGVSMMTSSSSSAAAATTEFVVGSGERVKSSPHSSREHARLDWMGEGKEGGGATSDTQPPHPPPQSRRRRRSGEGGGEERTRSGEGGGEERRRSGEGGGEERREFRVESLQNHRSSEEVVRELEEEMEELRAQLVRLTEEKEVLRQDRERVSAQWEGKVRRLRKKLGEEVGAEALEVNVAVLAGKIMQKYSRE